MEARRQSGRRWPVGQWLAGLLFSPKMKNILGIFGGICLVLVIILKWRNRH